MILCTCVAAGSERIVKLCNDDIEQCIVDESGMCMEPETLVPIRSSRANQIVLIGDHKQLQPIVKDDKAKAMGLGTSLFERYSEKAFMLELQYRMVSASPLVKVYLCARQNFSQRGDACSSRS